MATPCSTSDSDLWRLDADQAILCTPQLSASIDLLNPCQGFHQLIFQDVPIRGSVLGVCPGAPAVLSKHDLHDVFVRGSDLVVTYTETQRRPFSLQIYWRAVVGEQGELLLDTILSLQTDLLESFPGLAVETRLLAATAWLLPLRSAAATAQIVIPGKMTANQAEGLLLRSSKNDWSYAEITHPEDRGVSQVERCQGESLLVQRQLGGDFMEKGVIRRLRVRGVFLPPENDIELATNCLASLATENPPLTV